MKNNKDFIKKFCKILLLVFILILIALIRIPLLQNILLSIDSFLLIFWFASNETKKILVFTYLIRVSLLLLSSYVVSLHLISGGDAAMFESTGLRWSQNGIHWILTHFTSGALMYSWFIAIIYHVFGHNPFVVQFVNVVLGTFSILYVYLIVKDIFNVKKAVIASYLTSIFPSIVYFSVIILREAPIIFFFMGGVYFLIRWFRNQKLLYLVLAESMFVLDIGFHTGILVSLFVVLLLNLGLLLEELIQTKEQYIYKKTFGFIVSLFFIWFEFKTRFGFEKLARMQPAPPINITKLDKLFMLVRSFVDSVVNYIGKMQAAYSYGRALYLQNLIVKSFSDIILQIPLRLVYFLFSPFPWMLKEPIDFIGFFDAAFYVILVILIFANIRNLIGKKEFWVLLILLIGELIVFGLITSNYGSALRHRAKFAPLLIVLASPTIEKFLGKKHKTNFSME